MSTDPLSPADGSGADAQSTPHPPSVHKPPMPPAPAPAPPTIQFPPHLQPLGLAPNPHVQVNAPGPPAYAITADDLNKEDVIFF